MELHGIKGFVDVEVKGLGTCSSATVVIGNTVLRASVLNG